MRRIGLAVVLTIGLFAMPLVEAQLGRIYGVGVVHQGGVSVQSIAPTTAVVGPVLFEGSAGWIRGGLRCRRSGAGSLRARNPLPMGEPALGDSGAQPVSKPAVYAGAEGGFLSTRSQPAVIPQRRADGLESIPPTGPPEPQPSGSGSGRRLHD